MESWNLNIGYPSRARILEYPRVNSRALNRLILPMHLWMSRNQCTLYIYTHTHTTVSTSKTNRFFLPDSRLPSTAVRFDGRASRRMIVDYAPTTRIPKNFSAISQRAFLDNSTSLVAVFSPLRPFHFSSFFDTLPFSSFFSEIKNSSQDD